MVTVLLADDHRLFRDGLRHLLEQQPTIRVVGEATDGAATVTAAGRLKPDIILMDISMPELNGLEATRRIGAAHAASRVIVLSMHSDQRFITEALKAGAMGYLLKDCAFTEVLSAIKVVTGGGIFLSPRIRDAVIRDYVAAACSDPDTAFAVLSPREREVLQLLAEGRSTKESADRLYVSVKTIETHRRQIMEKLDLHSVAELTKYAVREGLTPLEQAPGSG